MKNIYKAMKLCLVILTLSLFSACTTTTLTSMEPWQGKVWRAEVYKQFYDTSDTKQDELSEADAKQTHFNAEQLRNIRMAKVRIKDGWSYHFSLVLVPDSIEYEDIKPGAVVDVIVEPGPRLNFSTYHINRILKLVCRADDSSCISREKSEKRFNSIIDANPIDPSAQYGATYNRRNTPEEIRKYD